MVWAFLCPIINGTTHEATLVLLVLLLLEGSGILRLVVLALALTSAMRLQLLHHVSTGLTINTFRLSILSPRFLFNIKRGDQV